MLRSPHLLPLHSIEDGLRGDRDALCCTAAAVAWCEDRQATSDGVGGGTGGGVGDGLGSNGVQFTLDDGVLAMRCVATVHTVADLLGISAADLARLPPEELRAQLDGLLVSERVWALSRADRAHGWRLDCACSLFE